MLRLGSKNTLYSAKKNILYTVIMHLVVGLGNPGEKYKNSRHNAGFILLDGWVSGWEYDKYADAQISKTGELVAAKPQTFMNNSGMTAASLVKKYSIASEHVIVIHDDIDLPFGKIKIASGSGHGGHNGVRGIIDRLGTNEFIRIKIGIAPTDGEGKAIKPKAGLFQSQKSAVSNFVLKDFSKADLAALAALAPRVRDIINTIVHEGKEKAMNKFN